MHPVNQCNCFVADKGGVLMEGDFYVNSRCTRKSTCRNNQIIQASYQCSDHATCAERNGVRKCYCNPNYQGDGETCIHNCFVADIGSVLGIGDFYVNTGCTRRSTCQNNQIIETSYQCSVHATCAERSGVRKCYCNQNYEGEGETCTRLSPKDCYELYVSGTRSDGVYTIYPDGWPRGIQVYCEMESNGGGWTVFQRRSSASVDFYRGWSDYRNGFGNKNHDHWLGNKYIYSMTNQKTYKLRIDIRDSASSSFYAIYSTFSINNEADKFRLSVGSAIGNLAGTHDNALSGSNNKQFSTKDRDNDGWSSYDCAERHRGAWWFYEYYHCRKYNSASQCRSYCPSYSYYCMLFPDGRDNCAYCAYSHLNGDYEALLEEPHVLV
ncbi:putative ficolin-1-like isoform X1 [Apostichopus japonicus]|uniref:Putative ficolin-1-like isoform X1 n=1 Tax=Stichopus japonicus TaxID=307972 RepID=A0A2G8LBD1_STIJA|nr:putative ficolin-1-like isoform X1 [Apostichopus japonicus]